MSSSDTMYFRLIKALPKGVRDDVLKLYYCVTLINSLAEDSFVDPVPYRELVSSWNRAKKKLGTGELAEGESEIKTCVRHLAYLVYRYGYDPKQIDIYLKTLLGSSRGVSFITEDDQAAYMKCTVEIVAELTAKIIGIKDNAFEKVHAQARAFQQAIYMRDSGEDSLNSRVFFARDTLVMCGLKDLDEADARKKPAEFREFVEYQAARFNTWQSQAKGLSRSIPLRSRMALRAAIAMHLWIVRTISETPYIVFEKKVVPQSLRLTLTKAARRVF